MQTSKILVALGVAVLVSLPHSIQAGPDTEAQAKLREALRLKLAQEAAQAAQAAQAAGTPAAPAPAVVPAVVVEPAAPTPPPKPAVAVPAPVVAPPVVSTPPPAATPPPTVFVRADDATAQRTREALRAKLQELQSEPVPTSVAIKPTTTGIKPRQTAADKISYSDPTLSASGTKLAAVTGPASPLPKTKQGRLALLLQNYKADAITAQEYHSQRAAILAEP